MGRRPCHAGGRCPAVGPVPERTADAPAGARGHPCPAVRSYAASVVRVLASGEHGEALEPVLRAFELLLLREKSGLLPALDTETPALAPLEPGPLRPGGRGWPARRPPTTAPALWARSGRRCSGRWTSDGAAAGAACRMRGVDLPLRPSPQASNCARCCNTIAAVPLRTRQLMMDLQSLCDPPSRTSLSGQRQQGRPGAQHAPPGHSVTRARPSCACRRGAGITVHPPRPTSATSAARRRA